MSDERKITAKMSYETLLDLPDSKEKFLALEYKLLKLQFHGNTFFKASEECKRLGKIYRKQVYGGAK
jgi:hypothetical protein